MTFGQNQGFWTKISPKKHLFQHAGLFRHFRWLSICKNLPRIQIFCRKKVYRPEFSFFWPKSVFFDQNQDFLTKFHQKLTCFSITQL